MNTLLIVISCTTTSFLLTFIVRRWALRKAILDRPNERSSHTIPTPRGGGIAVAITWFLTITLLFIGDGIDSALYYALLCGLPISVIGLMDDMITIIPKIRLLIQVASALLAITILGGLNGVDIGFSLLSSPYLFSIIAVIGIIWFTNLFNFLDGIDGYISAEVVFIGLAMLILSGIVLPVFLAAATAGFLIWNWQPAKIFMGDVGSTLLGFSIGVLAIHYHNSNDSSIIIWLMITSLFWFDATLTIYRRWRNNEQLSKAHRKHAYQRMVQSGFSHQKTVLCSTIINLAIMGLVYLAIKFPNYSLPLLGVNILFLYTIIKMVDKRFPFTR